MNHCEWLGFYQCTLGHLITHLLSNVLEGLAKSAQSWVHISTFNPLTSNLWLILLEFLIQPVILPALKATNH